MNFWERVLRRMRLRRLRYWETRYIEAHGRVIDIEMGQGGITWKMAMADRTQAENNCAYYQGKLKQSPAASHARSTKEQS